MLCYFKRPWGQSVRRYSSSKLSCLFETTTVTSSQSTLLPSTSSSSSSSSLSKPSIKHKFSPKNGSHFKDSLQLEVVGGKGGDGCASFLREAHRPKGPPAGGNGGKGGDVIFVATPNINTLSGLKSKYLAPTGQAGRSRACHGSIAVNLRVPVPLGTVVKEIPHPSSSSSFSLDSVSHNDLEAYDQDSLYVRLNLLPSSSSSSSSMSSNISLSSLNKEENGNTHFYSTTSQNDKKENNEHEEEEKEKDSQEESKKKKFTPPRRKGRTQKENRHSSSMPLVPPEQAVIHHELTVPGEELIVAKGGRGGFGNAHFSTSNRGSRHYEFGEPGEHRRLHLELKLLADLGLVGLPNAGKSSLLQCLTQSTTKIASYPFTTLTPHLGTLIWPDAAYAILADLPGLVEQAHENVGLGHAFLKHIERCPLFLLVVDVSKVNPVEDVCILLNEMEQYHTGLTQRPAILIGNKADKGEQAKVGAQQLQTWAQRREYEQFWPSSSSSSSSLTWPVVLTSAKYRTNLPSLLLTIRQILESQSALRTYHPKSAL